MESYLSYLQHSLGLDHVILPVISADAQRALPVGDEMVSSSPVAVALASGNNIITEAEVSGIARFHFHCVSAQELSTEEEELFQKIILALKLGDADYSTAVGLDISLSPITVVFSDAPDGRGVWQTHGSCRVLHTYSLRAMLANPGFKKECWAHLQTMKLT